MSVLPLVSFIVVSTAVLAFALLGLIAHDELKFQRQHRAANDSLMNPSARRQPVALVEERPSLPKAA
ncbi:MAG: hypothetical protein ACPHN2_20880 [Sinimarinibacterium flocculans]|jgi:hypothetical protein|uniref:Uncharacterized protein n=1 Tax=Sinimarinibacterium flocculans TaxID=985250 RepID=A0A318E676_9GAMM|nr:hypothetical protein [Sinimarinibacterium flocculans]MEC9365267.1 hypothetical protein [Pseudomonadota bacterium]PXV66136.1 hypothetical protein C8D93_108111 [Sinimarinibacterium flocculans]